MNAGELSEILHRVLDVAEENVDLRGAVAESEIDRLHDRLDAAEKKVAYLTEDRNYWKSTFDLTLNVAQTTKSARDMALSNCAALSEELRVADERIKKLEAAAKKAKPKKVAKPAKK